MRAIDFLMTLDDVDPQRLGITGNSGGGLNTLFTGALDERLQAAVVVGFTFEFRNWLKYGGAHCTCTHLPGIFQEMQWCEIAGLTAPRKLMMLQGANDNIFPISGARHSGAQVENVYNLLEAQGNARFVEMPGLPHAYSRPYREQMYGWMVAHLKGQAYVSPLAEPEVQPLPEKDPRLLCDPDRKFVGNAPTVVELARRQALETVEGLPGLREPQVRESIKNWARTLTAPPEVQLHSLSGRTHRKEALGDGVLELFSFNSEDGQSIPGLAWYPTNQSKPSRLVLIADARGKAAVAESGFVKPLVASGRAVIALDLRGRGETLDQYGPNYDVNFRLVANQVLFGRPLAGRRAFDLQRAMDYLGTRREFTIEDLTVVGVGDDALSALLASVVDPRVRRLVMASYVHSFISQMRARNPPAMENMGDAWNDPQLNGHIRTGDADLDFGAVIPSVLQLADVPELTALLAPRQLLVCQMRDLTAPDAETLTHRFRQLAVTGINSTQYLPTQPLEARLLLKWLDSNERP